MLCKQGARVPSLASHGPGALNQEYPLNSTEPVPPIETKLIFYQWYMNLYQMITLEEGHIWKSSGVPCGSVFRGHWWAWRTIRGTRDRADRRGVNPTYCIILPGRVHREQHVDRVDTASITTHHWVTEWLLWKARKYAFSWKNSTLVFRFGFS